MQMSSQTTRTRRRVVVDNRALALTIGSRIRAARLRAGLTQQELAGDRYTKAYISALELGHAKPSMAALDYLAPRLGTSPDRILAEPKDRWTRLDADLRMAAGAWVEATQAYEELLETATDRTARAEMQLALGEALCRTSRITEAARPLSDALQAFAASGRAEDHDRAQYWLAYVHHVLDDVDEARRLLHGVLGGAAAAADPEFAVRARIALAQVESAQRNHDRALTYLEEARASAEQLDLPRRATWLDSLARARHAAGDAEGAIRAGMDALALYRAVEATHHVAGIENELAGTFVRLGNLGRARELGESARAHALQAGDAALVTAVVDTLAGIALAAGDHEEALRLADDVLAEGRPDVSAATRMSSLMVRARALGALGRPDDALPSWEAAAAEAAASPSAARRRDVYGAWAESLATEGRHAEAYEVMRRALED